MHYDRYGNPMTTSSPAAAEQFSIGLDRFLGAAPEVEEAFRAAVFEDERFALAHLALARVGQVDGDAKAAGEFYSKAVDLAVDVSDREASLIKTFGPMLQGRPAEALQAVRRHLDDFPSDAFALQTCTTVFGLIGFSGLPGREAEQLALTTMLAPTYGDDWWFLSQHAFSQIEVGQIGPASANIEKSFELNPKSGQMAHVRSHVFYEAGEDDAGFEFLNNWLAGYDPQGLMHGHISWHQALWALDRGDEGLLWSIIDEQVSTDASSGPPLVKLCDTAAILYRASLKGLHIPPDRWQRLSEYAAETFPNPGNAFGDVHAAVAHSAAGNERPLSRIIKEARGPAADVVEKLASAFLAIGAQDWAKALEFLTAGMVDHARIGGSKAQRDLIELAHCNVLVRLGRRGEAARIMAMRRPVLDRSLAGVD